MLPLERRNVAPESVQKKVRTGNLPRLLYAILLNPGEKFGTLEEQIILLAQQFREEGGTFVPLFISPAGVESLELFQKHGIQAEILDLRRFRPGLLTQLMALLRKYQIEAIHWNFTAPLLNRYLWILSILRPNLVHYYTCHFSARLNAPPPAQGWKRWFKRILLRRYARVFAVSQYVADDLHEQGTWSNVICCPHFLNIERFRPDAEVRARVRQEMQADGNFVVVQVGQLIPEKGVDVALKAMTELPDRVVLWVIGTGPDRAQLEEQVEHLGLQKRVTFMGLQMHVQPFFQAADCMICPSRWGEAAGLVNLEGASCGLPIVGSDIGGIPEALEDGRSGLLFPPGNASALADCLRALLESPEACRRMGESARLLAIERFSAQVRLPAILDLYR